jgi:hypothetical protein
MPEEKNNSYLWISHSSISDFEVCPQLYYFKHLYRDPLTNHRIQAVNPYLTLGITVHNVIEKIAFLRKEERLTLSLKKEFQEEWSQWTGKKGGFFSKRTEEEFKKRGSYMVEKFEKSFLIRNPNLVIGKGFKGGEKKLLKVKLFKNEDLVLVGSIDWIEILPNQSLHIVDFKTGRNREDENSLQLPIYYILTRYNIKRPIERLSYWYLEDTEKPFEYNIISIKKYISLIRYKAITIKNAIKENRLVCRSQKKECSQCREYKKIVLGQAEYVGYDQIRNKDLYLVH